ncbi:aspartate carbamoyltransferase catalytic subunit [Roseivivax halodurans JCM 10272]|uniref:Aspartate carbamoyltransferase catalytic subunit n=1 Tax=Roseivivax halodurans JCM 10272 TaxID=1449350 RepID=X7EI59_9RHOB|nr:hypothetical protein [Roseivivax halodurans]ETX14846.1 aspartate carbamoyltransferase catalytic subunit [Roseivivax halodurans JCM 10272]
MTEIHIPAGESDVTRVFHLDLPAEAVARFSEETGTGEWPLQDALGADSLRKDQVEIVTLRDLGTMPLSAYLAQAYDLEGPDFARDRPKLDTLSGHVLVLPGRALGHSAQTLHVQAPLTHVGSYGEPKRSAPAAPLHSTSAEGSVSDGAAGSATASRSPVLRALALVVLALLAGVVLFLVVGASS